MVTELERIRRAEDCIWELGLWVNTLEGAYAGDEFPLPHHKRMALRDIIERLGRLENKISDWNGDAFKAKVEIVREAHGKAA